MFALAQNRFPYARTGKNTEVNRRKKNKIKYKHERK